ncbi:polyprenol monophosphomannose synthase [Putridiphycobacter roseus]|uniref:Polyprenol monophosphomannose synthase n=1 Tax=Putridiphycobacter roseus TaxID=2219161 RepID=A0A2W1NBI7_9FLAO|nr:polyprenol monophosphomannose synthase [Putridiphycobacter roseus]PZE16685.1 polyprenol monophosphomannose synthase [Putridiphycobacter roseus]
MNNNLVIIPTYNEKENIVKMIHKVMSLSPAFDLLIVDDGSPDGTAQLVKALQKEYPDKLFIEERSGKLGLGTAYIHGFKWALNKSYEYICEMDADFSHNPDDLIRLVNACKIENAQLAIGSRYIKGGKVANWDRKRLLLSFLASFYVRMILWIRIKDTTAGFKCYHREVLEKINFDLINFKGYAFQICMKYAAIKMHFKVVEVPITFIDREFGTSKMSTGIFKEAILGVWRMKFIKF